MSNTRRPKNPQLSREHASKSMPFVVAAVVLVCIGAIVGIAVWLNNGSGGSSASASTGSTGSTTPTGSTTAPTSSGPSASVAGCTTPPSPPANPQRFASPPPKSLAENTTWTATMKTTCGDIVLSLDGKAAPQTVSSFIFLAQKNFFDDSPCHRLTTAGIYVLQCGDPTGTGGGGPGYSFGIENAPANGDYPTGTLAMARASSPNSNGSQFFMVYKDTKLPTQGGGYTIFGKVTSGLHLLDQIAAAGVAGGGSDGAPAQPISILSVSVQKG